MKNDRRLEDEQLLFAIDTTFVAATEQKPKRLLTVHGSVSKRRNVKVNAAKN